MSETLYPYYERELDFIRRLSQEFARQYPAVAGRLLLEPNRSADPHVERLIESFALLAGRIRHKLDDEFPELTDALLTILYPHYLAPIPSMAVVQFDLDPARGQLPDGFLIDRHARLRTAPVGELPCRYRTGYPVTLWPVKVAEARLQAPPFPAGFEPPRGTAAALRLFLECQSQLKFGDLSLERLRFFLHGDNQVTTGLYELLFNHALQVVFRPPEGVTAPAPLALPAADCLGQVGFDATDGLLPYSPRSFLGYRLLTEFFAFPHKFLFCDLAGWKQARGRGFGDRMEVVIFLDRTSKVLEQGVDAGTFRLGATPVVNLFEKVAEPITLSHAREEYRIVPDVAYPNGMEVYSVEEVTVTDPETRTNTEYLPFYSFRHGIDPGQQQAFWYPSRRSAADKGDRGTDVFLHLVDLRFNPRIQSEATVVVRTVCTNRDIPTKLQLAGDQLAFEIETAAPLARLRCLRPPTPTLRPSRRRGAYWRLLSHLSLNHLSLTDPVEGRQALQELLRLYDFSDPESGQQQRATITRQVIDGITGLSSRRVVGRAGGAAAGGFCRGVEVTVEFDEPKYIGVGVYLFACVLERFLGLYVSLNSFSQLVARTKQAEGYIKKWPPRTGELQLL
jgi:type VI secretion system protein ImpG